MRLPNCVVCGKFVGYKKPYKSWIPYGNSLDLEPPEEECAHLECWENMHELEQKLTEHTSWCKPMTWYPPDGNLPNQ